MKRLKGIFKSKKQIELINYSKLHLIFVIGYLLQAVLLLILSKNVLIPITTNYLAYDPLLSSGGQVVHSVGTSRLFDINLAWLLAGMLIVSAIGHIMFMTIYKKQYMLKLKKGDSITRWVAYGVVSSFIVITLAILSGINDISSLLLMLAVSLFAGVFGYINEVLVRGGKVLARFVPLSAIKAIIIPWFVIVIYVFSTFVYGGNSINAFVYYIYLTVILLQGSFIYMLKKQYSKQGKWKDLIYTEKIFFIAFFLLQLLVVWQVFFGKLR